MSKIKRNDPCSCGSGKKYKKCCGASNVIELSAELYNEELDHLQNELLDFAMSNYEHKFIEHTNLYHQPALIDDEGVDEAYLAGLTMWIILNVPIAGQNQTIFDVFFNQHKSKIKRTRTRNTFAEWGNIAPSAYEVLSIDEETYRTTIKDLLTGEEFQVPLLEDEDYLEGSLVIGILTPYIGYYNFFFTMLEVFNNTKETMTALLKQHSNKEDGLAETFPDFLAEVLINEMDIIEWESPVHEMVAQLFSKHMVNKGFDDDIISMGVMLWHQYCEKNYPTIQKIGSHAAALEYHVQLSIVEDSKVTQKQIAKEYETTAGSVSNNYRKLRNSIDEDISFDAFNGDTPTIEELPKSSTYVMEQQIRDIHRQLEGQSFSSEEEANTFLNDLLKDGDFQAPVSTSPRDIAQNKLLDARETQGVKRERLIEEALTIYPNSPDAYLLMAEDADSELEYRQLVQKAVLAGEKDLGKEFFVENKGHFWMIIETRPYMRAKAMYASILYEFGDHKESLKHYEEMLRLNPNDNQGIRYILLSFYIELGKYKEAQNLMDESADEVTASFLFNKALLSYLTDGITEKTKQLIKDAQEQNTFVTDYLLKKKKIPKNRYDYVGVGDEIEAIVYVQENIQFWEDHPKLLKEL